MAEIRISDKKLLQLAELVMYGSKREQTIFLNHLSNSIATKHSEVSLKLNNLLKNNMLNRSIDNSTNSNTIEAIPIDMDSRLELLKIKSANTLPVKPYWPSSVSNSLDNILQERKNYSRLLDSGLSVSKAALFTGPPGTGKTLAAYWVANKLQLPLLILDLATVISSYLGKTGSNIKYVLDYAKNFECVLLLDELDSLAKKRDDNQDVGELKRLVTVLLQEIDEWPDSNLLIAATNHPTLLDPAVWRRFDPIIEFSCPESKTINRWVQEKLKQVPNNLFNEYDKNVIKDVFSIISPGYSFDFIDKTFNRVTKVMFLNNYPISKTVGESLGGVIKSLDKDRRIAIGIYLLRLGVTQRYAEDVTNISRKTLKKYYDQSS